MNYFDEFVTDGCAGRDCTGLPLFEVREQERFAVLCLAHLRAYVAGRRDPVVVRELTTGGRWECQTTAIGMALQQVGGAA